MTLSAHPRIRILITVLLSMMSGLVVTVQVVSEEERHGLRASFDAAPRKVASSHQRRAEANATLIPTNCRYGVAYLHVAGSEAWISTIHAGWTVNFSVYPFNEPNSEFIHTFRMRQDWLDGQRLPSYTFYPALDELATVLNNHPGGIWLVGNEIEINNGQQDNIMPDIYAKAYHEVYHFIKHVDPTARVGIGSVTMATPGRLQYLDIVWDTYQELYGTALPVDVWNFHLYIMAERNRGNFDDDGKVALGTDPNIAIFASHDNPDLCPHPDLPDTPENDPAHDVYCRAERDSLRIFKEQLYAMRRWMKDRGLQDKPLIISEYGSLPDYQPGTSEEPCGLARPDEFGRCMFPERVTDYLVGTSELMNELTDPELGYPQDDYRLVQRWLWYPLYTPFRIGGSSNLLVENYDDYAPGAADALTMMGEAFRQEAMSPSAMPNLVAGGAASDTVFVDNPDDLGTASLKAFFRNDGELSITESFTVTFYRDAALTQPIGSLRVHPANEGPVLGCAWEDDDRESAGVAWENLPVGTHTYWARIDATNTIDESAETDNVTTRGTVTVYVSNRFLERRFVPFVGGR